MYELRSLLLSVGCVNSSWARHCGEIKQIVSMMRQARGISTVSPRNNTLAFLLAFFGFINQRSWRWEDCGRGWVMTVDGRCCYIVSGLVVVQRNSSFIFIPWTMLMASLPQWVSSSEVPSKLPLAIYLLFRMSSWLIVFLDFYWQFWSGFREFLAFWVGGWVSRVTGPERQNCDGKLWKKVEETEPKRAEVEFKWVRFSGNLVEPS